MASKPEPRGLRRQQAAAHPAVPPEHRQPEPSSSRSSTRLVNGKMKKSYYLSADTAQRLKDAAKGTANRVDLPEGVSGMADAAINYYVDYLEREFNDGEPFPVYRGRSKRGPQQ